MDDHTRQRVSPVANWAGRWSLVAGRWSRVAGRWSLVAGRWSLVAGRWSLVADHVFIYIIF